MIHTKCLAILDTMWGGSDQAPGLFRINPNNYTGKRLYWFLGHDDLWVTNACGEYMANAKQHGTPNPERLAKNLRRITYDLLLVCGSVAKKTYLKCGYTPKCEILMIPHPARRGWTKSKLEWTKNLIQKKLRWSEYPTGTKAKAIMGGHWYKMENGRWKWHGPDGNGGEFPTPGGDAYKVELPVDINVWESSEEK